MRRLDFDPRQIVANAIARGIVRPAPAGSDGEGLRAINREAMRRTRERRKLSSPTTGGTVKS